MESALLSAIQVAQDPNADFALKSTAIQYLTAARNNAAETWPAALAIFTAVDPATGASLYDPQARYYALEIIGAMLDIPGPEVLDQHIFTVLKASLAPYVDREYINGNAEASQPYLRNKFSHTFALLFTRSYPDLWPTFIRDLVNSMRTIPQSGGAEGSTLNVNICLLMLRVFHEVSVEIADRTVKAARDFAVGRQGRETRLKHHIRGQDAAVVISALVTVMAEGLDQLDAMRNGENALRVVFQEMVTLAVQTYSSYIHWLDINLTLTDVTTHLLRRLIVHPLLDFRVGAAEALIQLVAKGVQDPAQKLQVVQHLALGQTLAALEEQTREQAANDDGELSFRETLGSLLDTLGAELARICGEKSATPEVKADSRALMESLLPVLLLFLADPQDDVAETVFEFLSSLLSYYKAQKKAADAFLTDERRMFLGRLLDIVIRKYQWDADIEWGASPEDPEPDEEELSSFADFRRGLKSVMDSIAFLDPELFSKSFITAVHSTLSSYVSGQQLTWQQVELCLQLIYMYGEIIREYGKGKTGFCVAPKLPKGPEKKAVVYDSFPLNPLGEMMVLLLTSQICTHGHPAVQVQWAEIVCRYSDFFKLKKEYIQGVLEVLVGPIGIQNPRNSVRRRMFYLTNKLIQELSNDIPQQLIEPLLASFVIVMNINPEVPDDADSDLGEAELLMLSATNSRGFDALLYLFEAAGTMIVKAPAEQQVVYLQNFTNPLLATMQEALRTPRSGPRDIVPILTVHHTIMALGNIAKGLPDTPATPTETQAVLYAIFGQVAEAVLVALEACNQYRVTRDATRFAYSRLLSTTGTTVMPYITRLLKALFLPVETTEISDLLTFMALVLHKLKDGVREVVDELVIPLHQHIENTVRQPEEGTDDVFIHRTVKRSYLTYLHNLLNSTLASVFLSPRNANGFEPILLFCMQIAEDPCDPASQKAAFNVLSRTVLIWGVDPTVAQQEGARANGSNGVSHTNGSAESIPGFEGFIYDQLIPLAFRTPLVPTFNPKDAESTLVMESITYLLSSILKARGQNGQKRIVTYMGVIGFSGYQSDQFVQKARGPDAKHFRKWFTDLIKERRKAILPGS